jgi:hypothetical protein
MRIESPVFHFHPALSSCFFIVLFPGIARVQGAFIECPKPY